MDTSNRTILLVDGEAIAAVKDAKILEDHGYRVLTVRSGEEAVRAATGSRTVDLVLINIEPGNPIDGIGAAKQILRHQDIPVVFTSSSAEPEILRRTEGITSYGFFIKDCNEAVLLTSVRTALQLHKRLAEANAQKSQNLSYELNERVKELNCVYNISRIIERSGSSMDGTLRDVISSVKNAMEEPDRSGVRISIGNETFSTIGFLETMESLSAPISVGGSPAGTLEVCYHSPSVDGGTHRFPEGEKWMVTIVAEQLSSYLDRRRTESTLHTNEARYRAVFDQSVDGICLADVDTGRIIDCNLAMADMVGRRRDELIGRSQAVLHPPEHAADENHPSDSHGRSREFLNHLKGTGGKVLPSRVITADGEIRDVEILAHRVHYLGIDILQGIFRDVTEVKTNRDRIAFQARLLEEVGQAIVVTDTGGIITYWNRAAETLFGWPGQEVVGRTIMEITVSDETTERAAEIMEQLSAGKTWSGRFPCVRKDGSRFPAIVSNTPLLDETGNVHSVIGITTDISELVAAEKLTRSLLEEKEILLQEVNHRIKNNMSTLISMLSLQAAAAKSEETRESLTGAMQRLTTMLLLYNRLHRTEHVTAFPADEYLRELVTQIRESAGLDDPVEFRTVFEPVVLDSQTISSLGIIINELCTNGGKYAFPDGEGTISLELTGTDDHFRLVYHDDGTGIPESVTTGDSGGLGLRLVFALVNQLDGSIAVDGDDGTRVVMEFPRQERPG